MTAIGVSTDYVHCADITRARARNFWYGIRLLPRSKRNALSAVYAFARRADDTTVDRVVLPHWERLLVATRVLAGVGS